MAEDETTTTAPESQEDTQITCNDPNCKGCNLVHIMRDRT